jgi:hypothetical protein
LSELAAVELARWPSEEGTEREDFLTLRTATHKLETVALIAGFLGA